MWAIFEKIEDQDFCEIIDRAIDEYRAAPLVKDFQKIWTEIEETRARQRLHTDAGLRLVSLDGVLNQAQRKTAADPEFVTAASKLRRDFFAKKITKEQFFEGCDALDQLANQLNPPNRVVRMERPRYRDND